MKDCIIETLTGMNAVINLLNIDKIKDELTTDNYNSFEFLDTQASQSMLNFCVKFKCMRQQKNKNETFFDLKAVESLLSDEMMLDLAHKDLRKISDTIYNFSNDLSMIEEDFIIEIESIDIEALYRALTLSGSLYLYESNGFRKPQKCTAPNQTLLALDEGLVLKSAPIKAKYTNISDILNNGYTLLDSGYILEHQTYSHLNNLPDDLAGEALRIMLEEEEPDTLFFYQNPENRIMRYCNSKGINCIGAFLKIEDKYKNSSFINYDDRSAISQIVAGISNKGTNIKLGDRVHCVGATGRVIWNKTEFAIYSDSYNQIVGKLLSNKDIIKIN